MLTAIEGHLVASGVQGFPAAGGAPGWGPGIRVGAGPGLHLLLQNQPANSTLELGVGERQDGVRGKVGSTEMEQAWERLSSWTPLFLPSLYPTLLAAKWSCGVGGTLMVGTKSRLAHDGTALPGPQRFGDGQMAPAGPGRVFHGTRVGVVGTHLFILFLKLFLER